MENNRGKGGGRPSKLSIEQKNKLKRELKKEKRLTSTDACKLIRSKFGIDYSKRQVVRILSSFKMYFGKPFHYDYRRPKRPDKILEGRLIDTFHILRDKGLTMSEICIGFFDETCPQSTSNTVRFWSFEKKQEVMHNSTKMRVNEAGFYSISGYSTIMTLENSKKENILKALCEIKEKNKDSKAIIIILDNFKSHKAKLVLEKCSELGIYLVFLPPYSPQLNPIEYLWKSLKRIISKTFIKNRCYMMNLMKKSFQYLSVKSSYAKFWIEKYLTPTLEKLEFSN